MYKTEDYVAIKSIQLDLEVKLLDKFLGLYYVINIMYSACNYKIR